MLTLRSGDKRGRAKFNWLDSYHSFSFGNYYDPEHMGFRTLRVINEDYVKPASGFGTHPHHNMEIITYVLDGELTHKDSMGNGSIIKPGEIQRMSAGTGVQHSEWNYSENTSVHLLQIWIHPAEQDLLPSYEQKSFDITAAENQWCLIASPHRQDNAVIVHQDAFLYVTRLAEHKTLTYPINPNRYGWLQVTRGQLLLGDLLITAGDGVAINHEDKITLQAKAASEVLLFDLA